MKTDPISYHSLFNKFGINVLNVIGRLFIEFFVIFTLMVTVSSYSQEKLTKVVEFERQLQTAKSDTERIVLWCSISAVASYFDSEKSKNASIEALKLAEHTRSNYHAALAISRYAAILINEGEYMKAVANARMALHVLDADTLNLQNNSNQTNKQLGRIYNWLGTAYDYNSEYSKALMFYLKANSVFQATNNREGLAITNNNLGISYLYTGNYDKSKKYFSKSYQLNLENGDTAEAFQTEMNLGIIHFYQEEFEKAIQYYKSAMNGLEKAGDLRSMGHCLTNLGETYAELGQYDSALYYSDYGIQLDIQFNDRDGLGTDYRMRGHIYLKMNRLDSAEYYYGQGLKIAHELNTQADIAAALEQLTSVEKLRGNFEKALAYQSEFMLYNDSLAEQTNSRKIGRIEAAHEYNQQLNAEKIRNKERLKLEAEKSKRQWLIIYFILGVFIVILFFVYMLAKALRLARNQKQLVSKAKLEIEEKNAELLGSIKYAERIQTALLLDDQQNHQLPDHFVFFRPKDIVSGDFFWSYKTDEYWYVAVADCTGHGVPGAMLTMLGTAYLNEISSNRKLSPGEILDELKVKFTRELSQTSASDSSKDGMDISLIRLDMITLKAEWAGANNGLYHIRDASLSEIKPTKQPIGFSDKIVPFDNHVMQLKEGEMLYLFSDGFPDQFGGPKGKKYKYSRFKGFLSSIAGQPISAQEKLIREEFESWKGDLEQLDDLCIIGIRL
jgi:serine phosphatase RsbU (regulator of sigma subunit)